MDEGGDVGLDGDLNDIGEGDSLGLVGGHVAVQRLDCDQGVHSGGRGHLGMRK